MDFEEALNARRLKYETERAQKDSERKNEEWMKSVPAQPNWATALAGKLQALHIATIAFVIHDRSKGEGGWHPQEVYTRPEWPLRGWYIDQGIRGMALSDNGQIWKSSFPYFLRQRPSGSREVWTRIDGAGVRYLRSQGTDYEDTVGISVESFYSLADEVRDCIGATPQLNAQIELAVSIALTAEHHPELFGRGRIRVADLV